MGKALDGRWPTLPRTSTAGNGGPMATAIERGMVLSAVPGGGTRINESSTLIAVRAFLQALDPMEQGIALHDRLGQLRYANRGYREAIAPNAGGEALSGEIRGFAISICALAIA